MTQASAPALVEVSTTLDDEAAAWRMARMLVEDRLAACVQVSAVDSVYRWDGAVQQAREFLLVCKTTAARCAALEEAIRAAHPYELPAIQAVAVLRAGAAYAGWVAESTAPA